MGGPAPPRIREANRRYLSTLAPHPERHGFWSTELGSMDAPTLMLPVCTFLSTTWSPTARSILASWASCRMVGPFLLHTVGVKVRPTQVRPEPSEDSRCLGYWVGCVGKSVSSPGAAEPGKPDPFGSQYKGHFHLSTAAQKHFNSLLSHAIFNPVPQWSLEQIGGQDPELCSPEGQVIDSEGFPCAPLFDSGGLLFLQMVWNWYVLGSRSGVHTKGPWNGLSYGG